MKLLDFVTHRSTKRTHSRSNRRAGRKSVRHLAAVVVPFPQTPVVPEPVSQAPVFIAMLALLDGLPDGDCQIALEAVRVLRERHQKQHRGR